MGIKSYFYYLTIIPPHTDMITCEPKYPALKCQQSVVILRAVPLESIQ